MSRTFDDCNECGTPIGPGVDPPQLCGDCCKRYPWAGYECENAYRAGYAAGRNDERRERQP